ncbi:MAG: hypothetical protein ACOYB2_17745, partial [Limnohabitans sp.]
QQRQLVQRFGTSFSTELAVTSFLVRQTTPSIRPEAIVQTSEIADLTCAVVFVFGNFINTKIGIIDS